LFETEKARQSTLTLSSIETFEKAWSNFVAKHFKIDESHSERWPDFVARSKKEKEVPGSDAAVAKLMEDPKFGMRLDAAVSQR
jgi:hypothetical protein